MYSTAEQPEPGKILRSRETANRRSVVTQITNESTLTREVSIIRELFRITPGLIAMIAVLTMAVVAIQGSESGASQPAAAQAAIIEPIPAEVDRPKSISLAPGPPALRMLVFYLVRTPGQAYEADWQENMGAVVAHDSGIAWPNRTHKVLFAGTEDEERDAGQVVLEHMLLHGPHALVEVIDMRGLQE